MRKFNLKRMLAEAKNRRERRLLIFFMVKLGMNELSPSDKVKLAEYVIGKMTGNANFPTPNPTLASVQTAATALYDAENAMDGTKNKTSLRNTAERALVKKLRALQSYVDSTADGDTDIITSAGMDFRNPRTPAVRLEPPVNLQAGPTSVEGEIKLKFKSLRKPVTYIIAAGPDAPVTIYEPVAESTKATVIIKDLVPGQKYKIRVAVINSAGISGWSEEVTARPKQD